MAATGAMYGVDSLGVLDIHDEVFYLGWRIER